MKNFIILFCIFIVSCTCKAESLDKSLTCLAKNIYFEARAKKEPVAGKFAVGFVTMNRVKDSRFPNTICKVVKQAKIKNGKLVKNQCHFSWYCDGKSDIPYNRKEYYKAYKIAMIILFNKPFDFTQGATHYHNTGVKPYWIKDVEHIDIIGSHIFYRWN